MEPKLREVIYGEIGHNSVLFAEVTPMGRRFTHSFKHSRVWGSPYPLPQAYRPTKQLPTFPAHYNSCCMFLVTHILTVLRAHWAAPNIYWTWFTALESQQLLIWTNTMVTNVGLCMHRSEAKQQAIVLTNDNLLALDVKNKYLYYLLKQSAKAYALHCHWTFATWKTNMTFNICKVNEWRSQDTYPQVCVSVVNFSGAFVSMFPKVVNFVL